MRLFGRHRKDIRLWENELGDTARSVGCGRRRPPIEQVAADLRRLRAQLDHLPCGASYVRSTGLRRAYDEVLTIACEELDVPTRLADLPDGVARDLERMRVEYLLGESGLQLQ